MQVDDVQHCSSQKFHTKANGPCLAVHVGWHLAGHMATVGHSSVALGVVGVEGKHRVATGPWKSLKKMLIFPGPGKSLEME